VKLEIEGSAGAVLFRKSGRILGQAQPVNVAVSRATNIRVEENRRLVVPGIRALISDRVKHLSTENSGAVAAVESGSREGWGGGALGWGQAAQEQKKEVREKASEFGHRHLFVGIESGNNAAPSPLCQGWERGIADGAKVEAPDFNSKQSRPSRRR